jgi:hypothetical protein
MAASPIRLRPVAKLHRLCLVLLFALCAPAPISTVRADTISPLPGAAAQVSPVCLGGIWTRIFHPFQRSVNNEAGMIRFGVVALISALYIIWWRR